MLKDGERPTRKAINTKMSKEQIVEKLNVAASMITDGFMAALRMQGTCKAVASVVISTRSNCATTAYTASTFTTNSLCIESRGHSQVVPVPV